MNKIQLDENMILSEMAYWRVPGICISYVTPECEAVRGLGVRNTNGQAVGDETVFCIASCSKAMTSAVIAMLVSEGKLDYDRPVKEYFPAFRMSDPVAESKATLRDMLCHRTGLGPHDGIWPSDCSPAEFEERFAYLAPTAPFREKAQYSNIIYTLAGHVAMYVTGLDWPELMKKYLFGPLGMDQTTCTVSGLIGADDHAEPFQVIDGKLSQLKIWDVDTVAPAASVNTTGKDMTKWLRFLTSGGKLPSGKRLISEDVFREMITKQIDFTDFIQGDNLFPLDGYSFGWQTGRYRDRYILRHTGKIEGYSSIQVFMPEEQIGVSVLVNFHSPTMSLMLTVLYHVLDKLLGLADHDWAGEFHGKEPAPEADFNDCYVDLFGERYPQAEERNFGPQDDSITGIYNNPGYDPVEIIKEGDDFYLVNRHMKNQIIPYFGGLYKVTGLKEDILTYDLPLSFIKDKGGSITALAIPLEPLTSDIIFTR